MQYSPLKQRKQCFSANCTKRTNRIKRQFTQTNQPKTNVKNFTKDQKQNHPNQNQLYKAPKSCVDPFKQNLKYLISVNANYFQSKIKISDKNGPNQYRFKIPTRTPSTIYKKHFYQKQPNLTVDNLKLNRNNLSMLIKKKEKDQNFVSTTTYQNSFSNQKKSLKSRHSSKKENIRNSVNRWIDEDAPRFLETQNKHFYLNWGGNNAAASMKPSHSVIIKTMPFDGRTVYRNDFQQKQINPSKLVIPYTSISKLQNDFMMHRSHYSREFENKQNRIHYEKSCKPKHMPIKNTLSFKGNTEYSSEFIRSQNKKQLKDEKKLQTQELQALILDL